MKKKPGQGAQLSVFDPRLAGEGLAATLVHEGIRSAKCAWLGGGCVFVCSACFYKALDKYVFSCTRLIERNPTRSLTEPLEMLVST